jgi:Regulator of chromosome condensation (RCC1) repeat
MSKVHPLTFASLTLPLLLAGCGTTAPTTSAANSDRVSVTLNSGLNDVTSPGLASQGLPSTGGSSAVTFIKVNVKDASGTLVTFDGHNASQAGGPQTFITLSTATPTAKLLLPKGSYSFESIGKENATGLFLAYGQDTAKDLSGPNPTVTLSLHTLFSSANSTLVSKLPTTTVNIGDRLDLRLAVKTPSAALDVSLSDYTVTYESPDITVQNNSKLGAHVQVVGSADQRNVTVNASVTGWVATGLETATVQSQNITYQVPLSANVTGLGSDVTPPSVSINPVTASPTTPMTLSGTANDDTAVARLQVFDGSLLIASTDAADVTAGAKLITFTGTTWSVDWTSGTTTPELTVVAADAAGNESRAGQTTVPKTDGTVIGWGDNQYGQATVPASLTGITAISAGFYHSLALKTDGTVVAWGANIYGETTVPASLTNVTAIAAGYQHSLALKNDGTVVGWGDNSHGQTTIPASLTNVKAISAGHDHSLALKTDGTVVAWGYNVLGQTDVPAGLTGVTAIAAGANHSLALKTDGTVVAWGYNSFQQTDVPTGLTNVMAIAAGYNHSLALKSDGTVVGWGSNTFGQTDVPAGLTGVKAIAAGNEHNLVLKTDGTVVAWGGPNSFGETDIPAGLTTVTAIAAGANHNLALRLGQ